MPAWQMEAAHQQKWIPRPTCLRDRVAQGATPVADKSSVWQIPTLLRMLPSIPRHFGSRKTPAAQRASNSWFLPVHHFFDIRGNFGPSIVKHQEPANDTRPISLGKERL